MVLGRHPPATARAAAGADGAAAGDGGECGRLDHGLQLPADLHRLSRPTPDGRALRRRRDRGEAAACRISPPPAPRHPAALSVDTRLADQPPSFTARASGRAMPTTGASSQANGPVWDRVAAGEAVIINEQLARRADLWPGDTWRITPRCGAAGRRRRRGLRQPQGQAVIGEALFRDLFPDDKRATRFGLRTDDPGELRERCRGASASIPARSPIRRRSRLLAAGVRADLHGDRRAQHPDAGRGRLRHADEPSDAGGHARAAAGAGMGARGDTGGLGGWSCCAR